MNEQLKVLEYNDLLVKDDILICFKGPFMEVILNVIGEKINILITDDPRLNKKVFSIFIELAQNIAYYSEERYKENDNSDKSYGKGTFIIRSTDTHYKLTSTNLIKKSWEQEVLGKCELINKLDVDGLRKLKRKLRNQPKHEGQLGGNIGLVDIALKAGSALDIEITDVDDKFSMFSLSIDIMKEIDN